jgi:serine/threonine protein kinase
MSRREIFTPRQVSQVRGTDINDMHERYRNFLALVRFRTPECFGLNFSSEEVQRNLEVVNENPENSAGLRVLACAIRRSPKSVQRAVRTSKKILGSGDDAVVAPINLSINNVDFDDMIIIKTLMKKSVQSVASIVNEQIVGFFALNLLRPIIPNFMYIFGEFRAGQATFSSKSRAKWGDKMTPDRITLSKKKGNVPHTIIEKISGETLESLVLRLYDLFVRGKISREQAFIYIDSIIAQVFCALALAKEKFDFSHNDLHSNNILVETYDEEHTIEYVLENETFYVRSFFIAKIIDFGRSHCKVRFNRDSTSVNAMIDASRQAGLPIFDITQDGVHFSTGYIIRAPGRVYNENNSLKDILKFITSVANCFVSSDNGLDRDIMDWYAIFFNYNIRADIGAKTMKRLYDDLIAYYDGDLDIGALILSNMGSMPRLNRVISTHFTSNMPPIRACKSECTLPPVAMNDREITFY